MSEIKVTTKEQAAEAARTWYGKRGVTLPKKPESKGDVAGGFIVEFEYNHTHFKIHVNKTGLFTPLEGPQLTLKE